MSLNGGSPGNLSGKGQGLKVTPKQRVFIDEYVKTVNGARAATLAGYKNPAESASALLDPEKYPLVAYEIQQGLEDKQRMLDATGGATIERVVKELAGIAFFNIKDITDDKGRMKPLKEISREAASAIHSMNISYFEAPDEEGVFHRVRHVDVKLHSKLDALKQIAQHLGALKDVINTQVNIVGGAGGQVNASVGGVQVIDWNQLFTPRVVGGGVGRKKTSLSNGGVEEDDIEECGTPPSIEEIQRALDNDDPIERRILEAELGLEEDGSSVARVKNLSVLDSTRPPVTPQVEDEWGGIPDEE